MALPDMKVEIAWDSGFSTPEGSRTWTDVSDYVEGNLPTSIVYGRGDEQEVPDAARVSLTFDNRDGRFTAGYTSGAYYPNVKKGKPLRISVQYNSVWYVRYVGYVNEWPVMWPQATAGSSNVTITATSRKARLAQTAELLYSPISYAYGFPDWPQAYWKMDYTGNTTTGAEIFFDFTNRGGPPSGDLLFVHTDTAALQPSYTANRREGPVDENIDNGMLMFPSFSNSLLTGTFSHWVGGNACKINTTGELTVELVARLDMPDDTSALVELMHLVSPDTRQLLTVQAACLGAGFGYISLGMYLYDDAGALLHYEDSTFPTAPTPTQFALATDGEIHHYALVLKTGGTVGELWLDGALVTTLTMPGPYVFTQPFTGVYVGADTYMGNAWIGHVAVRDSALTSTQIAAHAAGATTQDESVEERMERIAGYMGVPAAEVSAETTPAISVGDQHQLNRTPMAVLEELAQSTGGVLFDDRSGHLVMHARSHRYNQTAAFTLSATLHEVEADLTAVLDDRYLCNYITVSRADTEDLSYWWTVPTSVDAYGTYSKSLEMVTTSWEEARAAAYYIVTRYAEPEVRVNNVSVDLANLSTSQRALVLAADIGTLFNISALPTQAPTDPMPLYLEGYTETITSDSHTLTMNTTPGTWFTNVAVLDDASHDQLDSGIVLAY